MTKILTFCLLCLLFSCGNQASSEADTTNTAPKNTPIEEDKQAVETKTQTTPEKEVEVVKVEDDAPLGTYVGAFKAEKFREDRRPSYTNRINISIDRIREDSIFGHSVVAGNNRPFKGTYIKKEEQRDSRIVTVYEVKASEPGDDRYDGVFEFLLLPHLESLYGSWVANNERLAVSERSYILNKKEFQYDPNLDLPEDVSWAELYQQGSADEFADDGEFLTEDVLHLNASKRLLSKEEVENMYKGDLEIIRNSIYARHGYSFKNRKLRYIFDQYVDWYIPYSTDIRAQLTSIEKQNIDLLKRYEQHAIRYYDVFGR